MRLFNKLIGFLSTGLHGKFEDDVLNGIIFINLLSLTGSLIFLVFGIVFLTGGEAVSGSISLLAALLLGGSIFFIRKTGKFNIAARLNLTLVIFILLFLFAFEYADSSVIIWFPIVPVLSVFILGNRNGGLISFSFLLVTIAFFLIPEDYAFKSELNTAFKLWLLGLYMAFYAVSAIIEYYRVTNLRLLEIKLLEARNETRLKESFISKLSHQIRTPLSNIMLVGHMVNKVNLTAEQKDMMETIIASANNLVNTIENLAEIAEVDIESKKNLQTTGFNLQTTINSTIRLLTVQKEPTVEFLLFIDENLKSRELIGDAVRLKQIFLNLIETILKNKRSGKIQISIQAEIHSQISGVTEVRFEIKTSKPVNLTHWAERTGIPDDAFIGSTESQLINNLDLNIARKIIAHLGGKLHILQTQEQNRVFLFSLPFKSGMSVEMKEEGKKPSKREQKLTADSARKLKESNILLVEDNTINQKIVVLSLKKFISNIDVANNGKEALDKFGTSKYDIILMDVQMPVIDGFLATKKIREIEATTNSHTPIIAITANALHGDREKCLDAGMDDYISKPFHVEVLIDKIKQLLSLS